MNQNEMMLALAACIAACFCGLSPLATRAQTTQPGRFPKAEIKPYNGAPTLFINGQPNAGLTYMTYKPQAKYYRDFGKIGVDLASLSVTADFSMFGRGEAAVWLSPGKYDYSDIDNKMKLILEANPNAYVFPRVYVCSPPWWDQQHPDQLAQWDDGSTEFKFGEKKTAASWASEEYRKSAADDLRRFIEHVRGQWYADRVIGYHIAGGMWDEWFYWSSTGHSDGKSDFLDYSEPIVQAFRKFLTDKYGTDAALQQAWSNPTATLATAAIPTRKERSATDLFIWRDPAVRQNVLDYYYFYGKNVTDVIRLLARTAREATNGEQLVGVFYGYLLGSGHSDNWQQNTGHLALHELLNCPDIDFFTAPTHYFGREAGTGYSSPQMPTDAVRLYGKYFFDENDYRTHLIPWAKEGGYAADLVESETLQLRQLGDLVAHGWGGWWFDMDGGWYDEPKFMDIIRKLNEIGEKSIHFDRTDNSDIAVVVDERSIYYTGLQVNLIRPLIHDQILQLGKMGATYDWVFLDDLDRAKPYKFYIFLDAFHVDEKQKAAIDRLQARGAQAFLWLYGAGYAGEKSLDVGGCTALTGITMRMEKRMGPLLVKINKAGAETMAGMNAGLIYGTGNDIGPLLYPDDPGANVLGVLEGHGVPGLVAKKVNGLDVYYSAAPLLPGGVLRALAARAGVHIYCSDDDVLNANRSFLSLHTASAGVKHIRLPQRSDVYDVYNDKRVAKDVTQFDVELPVRKTVLYFLGSEAQWKRGQ